ncbi:MAG: alpha/beta hydrolase [Devosia sp.]
MIERRFISSDGVELVYGEWGPETGTPIVLCHGIAVSSLQFRADAEYFAGLGYRVLTPDLRGHGRSAAPRPTKANYALLRLARDQIEMLDHAGLSAVHWVGNSLGGIVALPLLAGDQARFLSFASFGTSYSIALPAVGGQFFVGLTFRVMGKELIARLAGPMTSRDAAAQLLITQMARDTNPDVVGAISASLVPYDFIGTTAAATLPILLLRCGGDVLVNAALQRTLRIMRKRPNFTLVEVKRGGHCANLDATEDVRQALLAFWAKAAG